MEIQELKSKLESLLYVCAKPLSLGNMKKILNVDKEVIQTALDELIKEYEAKNGGIMIANIEKKYRLVTNPNNAEFISDYIKKDLTTELSKPSLETLSIICYRAPVSKYEIELIRGVNCSLILRNLLMRGLVESYEDKETKQMMYNISFKFLQFLGINNTKELPNYQALNSNDLLNRLLEKKSE